MDHDVEELRMLESQIAALERAHENDIKARRKDITTKLAVIQQRLGSGETSGDRIRDFVLRAHGNSTGLEALYRVLEQQMMGKGGEFVLLHYVVQVRTYGPSDGTGPEDRYRLGVLEGDELVYQEGLKVTLPVSRYLEARKLASPKEADWTLKKGNIFEQTHPHPPLLGHHLLRQLPDAPSMLSPSTLLMYFGDTSVEEVLGDYEIFSDAGREPLLRFAASELSRLILEPTPA